MADNNDFSFLKTYIEAMHAGRFPIDPIDPHPVLAPADKDAKGLPDAPAGDAGDARPSAPAAPGGRTPSAPAPDLSDLPSAKGPAQDKRQSAFAGPPMAPQPDTRPDADGRPPLPNPFGDGAGFDIEPAPDAPVFPSAKPAFAPAPEHAQAGSYAHQPGLQGNPAFAAAAAAAYSASASPQAKTYYASPQGQGAPYPPASDLEVTQSFPPVAAGGHSPSPAGIPDVRESYGQTPFGMQSPAAPGTQPTDQQGPKSGYPPFGQGMQGPSGAPAPADAAQAGLQADAAGQPQEGPDGGKPAGKAKGILFIAACGLAGVAVAFAAATVLL